MSNQSCVESFNLERFRIIKSFCEVFDFVKMETICFLNREPTLYKQKNMTTVLLNLHNALLSVCI